MKPANFLETFLVLWEDFLFLEATWNKGLSTLHGFLKYSVTQKEIKKTSKILLFLAKYKEISEYSRRLLGFSYENLNG